MQQNLFGRTFCQRRYVRFGTVVAMTCVVVILALVIRFVILSHDSDSNGTMNNDTTGDDNSNRASTDVWTTHLSTQMTSVDEDTGAYISTTFPPNQWIIDSHLITSRAHFPAINMRNGEIFVCGGYISYSLTVATDSSCEIYSSLNRKWRTAANMNVGRVGHTLTLLPNGRHILAIGSDDSIDGYTGEIYDIETDRWAFVPNIMSTLRSRHTATLLHNGQVLIVGGATTGNHIILSSVQLYIPSSNAFITTGSLNIARHSHTAILLNDGLSVLIIGGPDFTSMPPEIYKTDSRFYTAGDMMNRRAGCAAVLLANGNVLVAGGTDSTNTALSSAEVYNPITSTFSLVQSMACARSKLTLTLLPSGEVLAIGGKSSAIDECLRISELFNPTNGQWTCARLLNTIRYDHNAVLVNNSVLIIGGSIDGGTEFLPVCERYDL